MRDDMNYEADYADPTQSPDFEPGDEGLSNTSANPTFYDVVETARASRRSVLFGDGTEVTPNAPAPTPGQLTVVDPFAPTPLATASVPPHPDCPVCF